jgi:hypothetical protein
MPLIERGDRACRPALGEDDHRGIGESELEVAIARAQVARELESSGVGGLDDVRGGQIVDQRKLGVDAEPCQDQMVRLGCGKRGDDQLAGPLLERRDDALVFGVARVGDAVQRARVDDQRGDRPSSARTISSALHAIGEPSPRPTAVERMRRGPSSRVVLPIASRMMSACERPVSAAIRRSAAASRSSR